MQLHYSASRKPLSIQYSKTFLTTFKGPFNGTINAYGNFDLNVKNETWGWSEDRDELTKAQSTLDSMMDHYNRSQFQKGATYSLEYYRDSSLRTVAYILYKVNASVVNKYYALRTETANTLFYLGSEQTFNVRPGREMPFLSYTTLQPA